MIVDLQKEFQELKEKYSGLTLKIDNKTSISGLLCFTAEYNSVSLECEYYIKIIVHDDYPDVLPLVYDRDNRIPDDFHKHHSKDKEKLLCLGSKLSNKILFNKKPKLIGFVDNLVVPYLYSHEYFKKYNEMPFGELSHGNKGLIEDYLTLFNVSSMKCLMIFLRMLSENYYRGHLPCPCLNGEKIRACHGPIFLEIKKLQSQKEFCIDYLNFFKFMKDNSIELFPELYSDRIARVIKKL